MYEAQMDMKKVISTISIPLVLVISVNAFATREFARGMNYVSWWYDQYDSAASDSSLQDLQDKRNCRWVSILVTQYLDNLSDTSIEIIASKTPTDKGIVRAIEKAHALGMNVALKPHVDVGYNSSTPRTEISYTYETDWQDWFNSYKQFINYYAEMAEANGVELFVIGTELKGTSHRESDWRSVIEGVKSRYSGKIVYAANHDEYQRIGWWDTLDFIGIDAYFLLTSKYDPTVQEMREAFNQHIETAEAFAKGLNKRILLTEIGFQSRDGTNMTPWWSNGSLDLKEQADAYEATLEVMKNNENIAGAFWWNWLTWPTHGGANDTDFTPHGKPAEEVLTKYYSGTFAYENAVAPPISDAELLDKTEAQAAKYFFEEALSSGLVKDRSPVDFSSIAATGFGLTAFTIMTERYGSSPNWTYSPEQLRERANQILDTLIEIQNKQTISESEYGKEGLFYHFIMPDGTCALGSEVSTVDTAILFAGVITAGEYYGGEVKQKSDQIVDKANWAYFLKTPQNDFPSDDGIDYQFSHGWKPSSGIFKLTWNRPTDEAILVSVIALASGPENTDFQKSLFSWPRVKRSYASYEVVNSYFGSLFTYTFGHVWIDFEVIGKDKPEGIMPGVEGVDWWQNSVNAAKAARQFAIDNADIYSSYGPDSWGLSAVEEPNGHYEGRYGALPTDSGTAFHDGTVAPYSSISTIALFKNEDGGELANNKGFRALRNFYDTYYLNLWGKYGPKDSFNFENEFSMSYLGIDQGPIVTMIENYRTGFVWKQFQKNEQIKAALKKVFEFLIEIAGDFCGPPGSDQPDGYVDYWDLLYFAQRWHTSLGDPDWDSRCDLAEEDNYVDYWDLLVFAQQWHKGVKP